jgi:hypothetical protein
VNDELALAFADLFRGRLDAYGTDEGGCDKQTHGTWDEYLLRTRSHLYGAVPIGVYPLLDDGTVHWGCVDFDEGEDASFDHARNLANALSSFDMLGHIERSRSKGYHVWCFWPHPQDALTVRRALLAACQIVDAPTKEINPKQTVVADGQVGNYVRLPYPNGWAQRQCMVTHSGEPMGLGCWLDGFLHSFTDRLDELAALYVPPAKPKPAVVRDETLDVDEILARMSAKSKRMIMDPVAGDDMDRSRQLFIIGRRLADEQMLTRSEIEAVLRYADRRFGGKYSDRHDADLRFAEIVAKVVG